MKMPEGWREVFIDAVARRGSGHTPNKSVPEYWNGGIKWISLADSSKLDNRFISKTDKEISSLGIRNSSAVLHEKGTVVLSRDAGVGKSAIMSEDMAVSQHFITWTCDENNTHNIFVYYWLQYKKPEFEAIATGSTIKTIGLPYFRKLSLLLPPLSEQRHIASILSAWDDSLSTLARLIDTKRQQKRALAEQLLTGKRRLKGFEGEWTEQTIGDLFHEVTRFVQWDDSAKYTQAIVRRWSQGITTRNEIEGEKIKVKRLQKVRSQDFLISNIQAAYGAMAKVSSAEAGLFVSNLYTILEARPGMASVDFLDQFSRLPQMEQLVVASSNGFKAERIRLNFDPKAFLRQKLPAPPTLAEQQAIASILCTFDEEISALERLRTSVQAQKRGLMDLLLTGKVRVKVEVAA